MRGTLHAPCTTCAYRVVRAADLARPLIVVRQRKMKHFGGRVPKAGTCSRLSHHILRRVGFCRPNCKRFDAHDESK